MLCDGKKIISFQHLILFVIIPFLHFINSVFVFLPCLLLIDYSSLIARLPILNSSFCIFIHLLHHPYYQHSFSFFLYFKNNAFPFISLPFFSIFVFLFFLYLSFFSLLCVFIRNDPFGWIMSQSVIGNEATLGTTIVSRHEMERPNFFQLRRGRVSHQPARRGLNPE